MSARAQLLVSGCGLVTCVGYDAPTSCASLRAGLTRREPLLGVEQYDETELAAPLAAGLVKNFAEGFSAAASWGVLGGAAIGDLQRRIGGPIEDNARIGADTTLVCTGPNLEERRFGWTREGRAAVVGDGLLSQLQRTARSRFREVQPMLWSGHVGVAEAVTAAVRALGQPGCRRVLAVGVDTLVDAESVAWLERDKRLKTTEVPVGLYPGEAAACLLIESTQTPRTTTFDQHPPTIAGWSLESPGVQFGSEPFAAGRMGAAAAIGQATARAVAQACRQAAIAMPFCGDLYLDLNGEEWRAAAWGHAQLALRDIVDFERTAVVLPATSFAEIGAASGFAAICAANEAFVRGYARNENALICSVSESARVSAILLSAT